MDILDAAKNATQKTDTPSVSPDQSKAPPTVTPQTTDASPTSTGSKQDSLDFINSLINGPKEVAKDAPSSPTLPTTQTLQQPSISHPLPPTIADTKVPEPPTSFSPQTAPKAAVQTVANGTPPPKPANKKVNPAVAAAIALLLLVTIPVSIFFVRQQSQLGDTRSKASATCDNNVPEGGSACQNQGDAFQFKCVTGNPNQVWERQDCNPGGTCVGTACTNGIVSGGGGGGGGTGKPAFCANKTASQCSATEYHCAGAGGFCLPSSYPGYNDPTSGARIPGCSGAQIECGERPCWDLGTCTRCTTNAECANTQYCDTSKGYCITNSGGATNTPGPTSKPNTTISPAPTKTIFCQNGTCDVKTEFSTSCYVNHWACDNKDASIIMSNQPGCRAVATGVARATVDQNCGSEQIDVICSTNPTTKSDFTVKRWPTSCGQAPTNTPNPTSPPGATPTNIPPTQPQATATLPLTGQCDLLKIYRVTGTTDTDITAGLKNGTITLKKGETIKMVVDGGSNAKGARFRIQGLFEFPLNSEATTITKYNGTTGYSYQYQIPTSITQAQLTIDAEVYVGGSCNSSRVCSAGIWK